MASGYTTEECRASPSSQKVLPDGSVFNCVGVGVFCGSSDWYNFGPYKLIGQQGWGDKSYLVIFQILNLCRIQLLFTSTTWSCYCQLSTIHCNHFLMPFRASVLGSHSLLFTKWLAWSLPVALCPTQSKSQNSAVTARALCVWFPTIPQTPLWCSRLQPRQPPGMLPLHRLFPLPEIPFSQESVCPIPSLPSGLCSKAFLATLSKISNLS